MGIDFYGMISAWILVAGACLFLATRERNTGGALALGLALLASAVVTSLSYWTLQTSQSVSSIKHATFFSEALVPFAWFAYGLGLRGRRVQSLSIPAAIFWGAGLVTLTSMVVFNHPSKMLYNPEFYDEKIFFLGAPGFYFYVLLNIYLVSALVVLERTFTGMTRQGRWKMKLEVIGVGSIIAVQIVYYSQALMYRTIDVALRPVLDVALILGSFFLLYSRLKRGHPQKLSVSDTVVYRSFIVLAASIYLVFMGLVGEGVKFFGPSSNRVFVLVLALCCGVCVCLVCLSDKIHRKVQVLVHKHFYPHRYDYRSKWLEMTDRLSSTTDLASLASAIVQMYCHTFALKCGVLFLRKDSGSCFAPIISFEWSDAPDQLNAHGALVDFLQTKQWVFNRDENLAALEGSSDQELVRRYNILFAVPLFFNEDLTGVILLGNQINEGELLIYEDYDLMKTLASQSSLALHNLQLIDQLVESREMAAIGRVSTFVMHDLKNSVSNLALIVENANDYIDDHEFQQDMLETLNNSILRMKGLIGRLRALEAVPQLAIEKCDLKTLVMDAVRDAPACDCHVNGAPVDVNVDRQEMARVILNLVMNAHEAMAGGERAVQIATGFNGRAYLTVQDFGCGMTAEYIENKLYKPFETTKSKGFGVGLYQSRQVVEAHGGEMQVESAPGEGTRFTVWLPTANSLSMRAGELLHAQTLH